LAAGDQTKAAWQLHFYFCITIFNPTISALYSAFSAEDYDSMITGMVVAAV